MLKVGITGGKGGTGKSTIAINIAYHMAKDYKVLLVDCDADCPGDHILLSAETNNKKNVYSMIPIFDEKKCTSCGECADACRENAIVVMPDSLNILVEDLCSGCKACQIACPEDAIEEKQNKIGFTYQTKINMDGLSFYLTGGFAKEGFRETSKIVNATKKRVEEISDMFNPDIIVYDSAAGIHCNVISALKGMDYIFGVTEPTPSGAHDLKNILELLKIMDIDSKIILNLADIGDKKNVEDLCGEFNTSILEEIPHSRAVMESYAKGIPFVSDESLSETKSIKHVCRYIEELMKNKSIIKKNVNEGGKK